MRKIVLFISVLYLLAACSTQSHDHDEHKHENGSARDQRIEHEHDEHDTLRAVIQDSAHDEHDQEQHEDEYEVEKIVRQPFYEIIRTSGHIESAQGDEVTLTAIHEGMVVFNEKQLLVGKKVMKGDRLLTISGKELIHDNIEASYLDIKSAFEKAQSNLDRSLELNKDKIISDKELLDVKLEYEKAKNQYEVVKKNYTSGGQRLDASITGYVKDVLVSEGQYVVTGQPIIKLTKNKRLVIKADVPQRYFHMLDNIKSANFITVYDKKLYDIEDLNGQLISYGKTTGENSLFTPIFFEIDNKGSLLAGSFIEVFLKTVKLPDCIVIPKTAVLEESGRFFVYVDEEHECVKRYIEIDCNDGVNYHVTDGLVEGDIIVAKNPYLVKLSMLSGSLPEHSHSH